MKINLLLLSTCPVIKSYLCERAVHSPTVQNNPLWNWEYAWKLWDKINNKKKVKTDKNGNRILSGSFPKFTYIAEEVYGISEKQVGMYRYERVKHLPADTNSVVEMKPFASFNSVIRYQNYDGQSGFPKGYRTPQWWTAYNKIKHDMGLARQYVSYQSVVEAIGALFLVLSYCDPNMDVLSTNGLLTQRDRTYSIETRCYTCEVLA